MTVVDWVGWGSAAFGLALAIWFCFSLFYFKRPDLFFDQGDRRRSGDLKYSKMQPGSILPYNSEDGLPNGRRGRIWDELERDLFIQRKRNLKIRIIQ